MTLSADAVLLALVVMVAVSCAIAAVGEGVKAVLDVVWPLSRAQDHRRAIIRTLSGALGVAAMLPLAIGVLDWQLGAEIVVGIASGILAGAGSETIYRWVIREILPDIGDGLRAAVRRLLPRGRR